MSMPKFSVIIPTRNREINLALLLTALDLQTERSFETIVVNDGSEDNTEDVVQLFSLSRCITIPHSGPAVARNRGAREAVGSNLVFVDDDCVVPNDWLARYEKVFQAEAIHAVAGAIENVLTDNQYASVYQLTTEFFQKHQNGVHGDARFVTANNFACRKKIFDEAGGFDERFCRGAEDRELAARLINYGCSVVFHPEIKITHAHRFTFLSFIRHSYEHGQGSYILYRIAREKRISMKSLPATAYGTFFFNLLKIKITFALVWIIMEGSHLAGYYAAAISQSKKIST